MSQLKVGALGVDVALVSDERYRPVLLELVRRARRRVFASIFLVDLGEATSDLDVMETLLALRAAGLRGVATSFVIGGAATNPPITAIVTAARIAAERLNIPCAVVAERGLSSHKKVVVADDYVLLGSHNWSTSAFKASTQDSILLADRSLAAYFADQLGREWSALSTGGPSHAAS